MVPSGASQVGSRTLLAFASWPRVLSAMTQSSLHQPGSCEASSHVYTRRAPSGSVTSIWPALISSGVHDIGEPAPTGLAALGRGDRMRPELDLPESMGRPGRGVEGLLAHEIGEDGARLLAGVRTDVDTLEEVAVGWIRVDLALGRRPGDRQRGHDLRRPVLEADDRGHLAEPREVLRLEVEHRDPMAVDAAVDVDDEVTAARLGLHRRDPFRGLVLVEFHPEPSGRRDDPRDRVVR